ncbi:MAG: enoyl-CoA hydratase/isomerase family protein [Chloroflexi bacterium]|nr:enoyl-CoA hydratase/isomerase family protein [Chloroflexota bacterium]
MPNEFIKYEKKNKIAYVTINRPEVMNSLHPPAVDEFWQAWCDFRDDPDMWVAIVTGAGEKSFCVGADLKYRAVNFKGGTIPTPPGGFGGITNRYECFKPIIAAVNGYALGGGFEIALASDIIIAAEHAKFGFPEPTVGLMARGGGVQRLSRQVPLKVAMGIILTARQVSAQEACRIGLVNEVVPLKDLIPCAERWAADILRCAPLSVKASKETAMKGLDYPLEAAINNRYQYLEEMLNSEDALEGGKAFAEKRKPQWKGR